MKNTKYILAKYKFLALSPFKINCALGVIGFCIGFIIFTLDFASQSGFTFGKVFFILICFGIGLLSLKFIADIPEEPKKYDHEDATFCYKPSLQETRNLQRMLVMPVEDSQYMTSSRTRIAKTNNALRLSSFVVVFEREAYIFIRNSEKSSYSRELQEMQEIANRIARQLGYKATKLQIIDSSKNLPLNHSYNEEYLVVHLK